MTTGMMNDTDVQTDQLDAMEFDPKCETITTWVRLFGVRIIWQRCQRPASWMAQAPCCSTPEFCCQRCKESGEGNFWWLHCGRKFEDWQISWTRI